MPDLLVSLHDVTIRYPDQTSFSNISFEIKKGESWALTGPNEPLKNALLNALGGRMATINGSTHFAYFDEFVRRHPDHHPLLSPQKLVAFVTSRHQFRNLSNTTSFYYQQRFNSSDSEDAMKVKDYLASVLSIIAAPAWTLERTINELHLQPQLDKEVIKLSNGETKRVLIATALLRNPVMLLLDNPMTGLDVDSRAEIGHLISNIISAGTTVIMTTTPGEIPEGITHVGVIHTNHKIEYFARDQYSPQEVQKATYQHDRAEIKSLLSLRAAEKYEDIVLMKDVSIAYSDKMILDRVNWQVRQGERWLLQGPNGAGKSTLLSLINGDNPQAYANHIILFDRKKGSGESIWDIKRKIGFMSPELYQYFPVESSCIQAVESGFYDTLGLFRRGDTAKQEIALRWMRVLGVDHLAGKLLKNISASNQRLCLLARALVKSPALLILDEPCQGFDDVQVENFKNLIDTLCELSDLTLIYVSHHNSHIPAAVTRQIKLENGLVL